MSTRTEINTAAKSFFEKVGEEPTIALLGYEVYLKLHSEIMEYAEEHTGQKFTRVGPEHSEVNKVETDVGSLLVVVDPESPDRISFLVSNSTAALSAVVQDVTKKRPSA